MSMSPEAELNLEQHFLPAWAKESSTVNPYAKFEGRPERADRRDDRGGPRRDGPSRRPGGPSSRGPGGPGGSGRPSGPGGSGRPGGQGGPGASRGAGRPSQDRNRGPRRDEGGRGEERREPVAPPIPLPEVNVALVPEEAGVDSLSRQIRQTGRAYPLFDIAQMILSKPERYTVTFSIKTKPDLTPVQPLFLCALDDSLWLSEDDAVRHILSKHFATFYQPERTQIDPPKGVYTFVAQCGMSGTILGPPNNHDYQNQLRKLHTERFARMPFDAFKARVKIVKDEAIVKKWLEDQSWKTEFTCLNVPEPLKLANREEVEKHFREVHLSNIVKPATTHRLGGVASRALADRGLYRLARESWEQQRHFPIQIATSLSQQFASRGLQFFKVNRTVTHVSVARPHFLDLEATPVSDGVRKIVEFINAHQKCTHKQLLRALAPSPAPAAKPAPAEVSPATAAADAAASGEATAAPTAPPAADEAPSFSPEMTALMVDLHWLVQQGHVIEFATGILETAKRPVPKPTRAPKAGAPAAAAAAAHAGGDRASETISSTEPVSVEAATDVAPPAASAESSSSGEPAAAPAPDNNPS